jgi:SP family general alpha glucoside:H+ symporter-like MFS transporter
VPWGIFATIGPAYSSELLPLALRSYLTAYVNMCFAIGQFIGAGVLQSLLSRNDQWSYRIPYAVQWVWPAPLFIMALFMPESPWWLVRNGRYDAAEKTIRRLTAGPEKDNARQMVAMMIHTDNIEREIESGSSYWDCFKGSHRRRTEIACVTFAGQVLAGSQFAYSGTYFFEQAGISPTDAYKLGLGGTAIAFVGTILSWFLMKHVGRRTMWLGGMALMSIYLLIIGFLTLATRDGGVVWAQSALCIIWLFTFSLTVGPMGWSIAPEVSSTRLRSKTICLARNAYYLAIVVANTIEPYMMNPAAWNWSGKTGFFWFSFAFVALVWGFFRLTETKGRTFEELDIMFAAGVPTRRFKRYHVDAYAEDLAIQDRAMERTEAKAH